MKNHILWVLLLISGFHLSLQAAEEDGTERPQKVYSGIYLMNLYDLNINEYSFYADFYLWFKWKGELDPMNIEFVNALEKWGFTQTMFYDTAKVLPDGYSYNGMRIEGRFYNSFLLNHFPLDHHNLEIRVENVDYPQDSLEFVPDSSNSLFRPDFLIPGWQIEGAGMKNHSNFYQTNFGETGVKNDSYSNFTFHLTIGRPISYFLLKLLLPLLIVLAASLGGLIIHPQYIDARVSLPIGGLLSCVFLQQSYSSALPDVGYMVLMDKIYLLAYMLIGAVMLRVIAIGNKTAWGKSEITRKLCGADRRLAGWFFAAFLLGSFVFVLIAL